MIFSNYLKNSGFPSIYVRYSRYQDTDFLQLCEDDPSLEYNIIMRVDHLPQLLLLLHHGTPPHPVLLHSWQGLALHTSKPGDNSSVQLGPKLLFQVLGFH